MIDNLHIRLSENTIQSRRRKLLTSVFSILSLLSLLSLVFGFIQHKASSRNSQITGISQQVNWAIEQSRELVSVSPSRSLQILTDQEKVITDILDATPAKSVKIRLNLLLDLLKSTKENIGLVHIINNPEIFLDLSLIRSDASASQIVSAEDKLLVLDKNNRRLLSISVENHSGEVIAAGDSLSDVISFTTDAKFVYFLHPHSVSVLSLSSSPSNPSSSSLQTAVSDPDQIWQNPISLAVFAGNIYVLDQGNSEIYKYALLAHPSEASGEGGYGSRRRWFSAGVIPDLSDAVSLSVDGDAWIFHTSGQISRFRQGSPLAFSTEPFTRLGFAEQNFGGPISFLPTSSRLYLLYSPTSPNPPAGGLTTLTSFDRDSGGFISQWQITNVNPISFVVNEKLNKIFLLESSKIYSIDL